MPVLSTFILQTKFEMFSLIRSWAIKCRNESRDPDHAPFRDGLTSAGWDLLLLTYRPNLKSLSPFITKIWQLDNTHTHTALFPGLPGWAGTRKVKPIWILLKQETVSGNGISWAICKSAPRSTQITMLATHHSVFYRPDALPVAQPTASKHWRENMTTWQAVQNAEIWVVLGGEGSLKVIGNPTVQ